MVSVKNPFLLFGGIALVGFGVYKLSMRKKETLNAEPEVAEESKVVPKPDCDKIAVNCLVPPCPDPCKNENIGLAIV